MYVNLKLAIKRDKPIDNKNLIMKHFDFADFSRIPKRLLKMSTVQRKVIVEKILSANEFSGLKERKKMAITKTPDQLIKAKRNFEPKSFYM